MESKLERRFPLTGHVLEVGRSSCGSYLKSHGGYSRGGPDWLYEKVRLVPFVKNEEGTKEVLSKLAWTMQELLVAPWPAVAGDIWGSKARRMSLPCSFPCYTVFVTQFHLCFIATPEQSCQVLLFWRQK